VKLFVIGGGEGDIIEMIKSGKGNIFLEPVAHDEIPKYIGLADACVSPLPDILWWRVASSLKVMEYMACGKPIALTRMKAHTDVVPENNEGVSYFENVSPSEIAASLEKIIEDKEIWHSKKETIVNHARTRFSYKRLASELLSYYVMLSRGPFREERARVISAFKRDVITPKRQAQIDGVVYVRVQDVGRKFYITSERELMRSLSKLGIKSELVAYGHANEPDFVKLINAPRMNPTIVKLKMMAYNMKYRHKRCVMIFGKLAYLTSIPLIAYRKIFGGKYRLMFDLRSIPVETKSRRSLARFKMALRFAYRFYDGSTFITEGTKLACESILRKKFKRYELYPSGFNEEVMMPLKRDMSLRRKLNIADDEKIIFYHGSISKNRGLLQLTEAVEMLKEREKARLMVVGSGDEEIISGIKRGEGNIFVGPLQYDEIPGYIAISDVCVSPLPDILWWRIASALKVMEYMACGKPIALTRMKAHLDAVPADNSAIAFFDSLAPEEISSAIERLLHPDSRMMDDAVKLREHAVKNFTYDSIAKKLMRFYSSFYEG